MNGMYTFFHTDEMGYMT